MAKIVLIADDCRSKAVYLESCQLPDFYMADFAIQALAVRQYGEACDLLRRAGYTLLDKAISADIIIDHAGQLMEIRSLFRQNGIQVELSDIADSLYQA